MSIEENCKILQIWQQMQEGLVKIQGAIFKAMLEEEKDGKEK